jgi:adenosylcobinamide kinase/adenosylcobinamide-phosphate guanylyltransferase
MEALDDEVRHRVEAHRAKRPDAWRTIEEPLEIVSVLSAEARSGETVIIDCMTLWIANNLQWDLPDVDSPTPREMDLAVSSARQKASALVEWSASHDGDVIVVTNEVGMGVVPPYPLGRAFRDALGAANNIVAGSAGHVYHLCAGLVLELKGLGAIPVDAFGEASDHDPRL